MNYIKKAAVGIIFLLSLFLVACGTKDTTDVSTVGEIIVQKRENGSPAITETEENKTEAVASAATPESIAAEKEIESIKDQQEGISSKIINYETLGIKEYEYPSEFYMGDNLRTAITQLALSYDNFNKDSVDSRHWKEIFVAKFIQNSRSSFDYLDIISEKNNGQISADELNYIQYSLTGIELDISSYAGGFVNRYDDASALNYGLISGYDYEYTDNGVIVTADFEIGYDGTASTQEREITVDLVQNPYSCFDGYSVVSVSSKVIPSRVGQEGGTYVFYGTDMMEENNGVFAFEFLYAEEDLNYGHFVYVDMTESSEAADYVRQNAGSDFKVTFILNGEEGAWIENVVPVGIVLADK